MGRPRTPAKYDSPIAAILGENIAQRLSPAFPHKKTETEQLHALHSRCGVGAETIRRIIKGKVSPTVSKVDAIARGLGCHVWELFKPAEARTIFLRKSHSGDRPVELHRRPS